MGATKGRKARETHFRWVVLVMLCIAIYSFVYCYDNPNAMQNELIREYGLSQLQYNMLYSVYGYVNMIAPLIAGMCIDCLGIYTSTLGFYILIVIGQSFWVLGTMQDSYGLMVFGRAVFGVGAEQYHTSRKWLAYEYFTSGEYMLASGLTLSASRLASATQSYATTKVFNNYGITAALAIGWVLVVFSLLLTVLFTIYQKYHYADQVKNVPADGTEKESINLSRTKSVEKSSDETWDKFQLNALWKCKFDARFWAFGLLLIFFYSTFLAYSNVGSAFIQSRYQKTYEEGNALAPIIFWIAVIFTPIQGFLCDYYGKRMPFMLLSSFCLLFGHIFLSFIGGADKSDGYLVFGLILLGFGYAIGAGSCWPCCGIIVPQKYLAIALGFWACIDNGFQACCFLIVGALTKEYSEEEYDKESPNPARIHEFDDARYFWIALALCTMAWVLLLWYFDTKQAQNILGKPEEKYAVKRGVQKAEVTAIHDRDDDDVDVDDLNENDVNTVTQ